MTKKYKKSNRGSCGMTYVSSYRSPCNKLPLNRDFINTQFGGTQDNINNLDLSNGCTSYNVDVNSPQVAGRSVISGNPTGCLNSQMNNVNSFNPPIIDQNGGGNGASCSGVGFDLSKNIGGHSVIVNNAPNCLYGEVVNTNVSSNMNTPYPILSVGGGKTEKKKRKTSNKNIRNKNIRKPTTKKKKIILNSINKYCKQKNIKCSQKIKDQIYNIVIQTLCH